ncbi:MAG: CapA family protein [Chloroflexi bacterium]|nr:CapA family protein [Chloroflexota bacterium]
MARYKTRYCLLIIFLFGNILTGCADTAVPAGNPVVQPSANTQGQVTETAQPSREDFPSRTIWLDPLLPESITESLNFPAGWQLSGEAEASISIRYGKGSPAAQWILVLAASFPTLTDDVSTVDLLNAWQGKSSGDLTGRTLVMSEPVFHALKLTWGESASHLIQVMDEDKLLQTAWDTSAMAIIPFDTLEPRWKVISIDGESPIHNDFTPDGYALNIPISLQGNQDAIDLLIQDEQIDGTALFVASNRDASKLTVLAMTGVTALTRSTAYTMEEKGIIYPGQAVQKWLASADITHISNEVSFAENCPAPTANRTGMMFCSSPDYIKLLEYVGTDIVELTGDHLADWGQKAISLTLEMYKEEGWPVYGGGENLEQGKKAVFIEHNGNRLAFIGCNAKGAAFATATATTPGAVACDFTYLRSEIKRLADLGYLPIVSIQHNEYDLYEAQEVQERDFRRLAESGAVIISGSQSHRPQGMEFYKGSFLHYGLGNLFFDQYGVGEPNRQGMIDRHVFYDNRYISTELLTTTLVDFAQPRLMTAGEREALLEIVFTASGW